MLQEVHEGSELSEGNSTALGFWSFEGEGDNTTLQAWIVKFRENQ